MDRHRIPPVEGIPDLIGRLDRLVEQRPAGNPLLPALLLHGQGADRLVHGFAQRLETHVYEAVVPHVLVTSGDPSRTEQADLGSQNDEAGDSRADILLFDEIARGLERSMPSPMGKLDLPTYWTVREMLDVVITRNSHRAQRKQLRDALYLRHQDRSPTAGWIAHVVESTASHRMARFWQALIQPLLVGIPRAAFGWRLGRGRRLRWLGEQIARATGRSGRDVLGSAICLTRDGIERSNTALVRRVLLLSLLRDLDLATRPSLISPSRRRRVTPFVLLLTNVVSGNAAYRLLDTFGAVNDELDRGVTLILASVASGVSAPPSLEQGGDRAQGGSPLPMREAAEAMESLLRPGGRDQHLPPALSVAVPDDPHDEQAESWLAVNRKVRPEEGRWPKALPVATGIASAAAMASVAALVWSVVGAAGSGSDACPGIGRAGRSSELIGLGDGTAGCTFFPDLGNEIEADYRAVELAIAEENQQVLAAAERDLPYRTMVFFAPLTLPDQPERVGQSSLRQLRGIALAQAEANRQAETDENKVRARVLLANPGDRFAHGLEVAEQINRRVEEDNSIVGVLGIAQSRQISREAIAVLAEKNLPVVAGPVTGDAMITSSPYYYQVSPLNQRVAKMLVEVATNLPVAGPQGAGPDGGLRTADRAVIVKDHSDEYSQNLADDLAEEFTAAGHTVTRTFSYPVENRSAPLPRTGEGEVRVPSLDQLAQDVCTSIDSSRDVVFFASRAQQLAGMLNSMRGNPSCEGTITVLAGTDITKFVQNPDVDLERFPFLRLFYGAFASRELVDSELSTTAQGFVHDYEQEYGNEDLLVDMSDPALTYDALSTMQEAINLAFQGRLSLTPDVVAAKLADEEVELDGATGYITLGGALEGDRVPRNKPVLVVQATPNPTELLLSCGRFAKSIDHDTWGPADELSCPRDE